MNRAARGDAVDYLLGMMPEADRERIAERLLADATEFDRFRDAENDLFDAYAGGTLSKAERAAFERTLLQQPGAVAKLRLARALRAQSPVARRAWWGWALAVAAAGLLTVGLAWQMRERPAGRVPAPTAVIAEQVRLVAVTRSGSVPRVRLRAEVNAVDFEAPLPAGALGEQIEVTVLRGGVTVWSGQTRTLEGGLRWRTGRLAAGAYEVRVGPAGSPLAFFEFVVE